MNNKPRKDTAIELEDVWRWFGRKPAVCGLSLQIPRGSVFGLIGPNGAGKSTLIKMLMGLLRPTSGVVRVLGRDVFQDPVAVRQRVGYVPESHHIYRWMRVGQVLGFCRGQFDAWNDKTCQELLGLFELDVRKKVRHLSKGMLGKLALLLALVHEPELLILDEPMAGLDPVAREEFLEGVLRAVCARQQTVLFATHTMDDVQRLADTVGILYEGRLLVTRNTDDLLSTTKRIRATLVDGQRPAHLPDQLVWQRINGREWLVTVGDYSPEKVAQLRALNAVESIDVIDLGLEDLFKDYVRGQRAVSCDG